MKKLLIVLLFALLLTGCGRAGEADTTEETQITEPESLGLYVPNSEIEQQTGGAVRTYGLQSNANVGVVPMGSKLLLISKTGKLTVLSGELREVTATLATEQTIDSTGMWLDATPMGVAYYTESTREVVLLNPQLQESARHTMPENMNGSPAVCLQNNEAYYCVGQEIRALNLQTGISRLIKSHSCKEQEMAGMYFNGKVLACKITSAQDESSMLYLSSENGLPLSKDGALYELQTTGQVYYARRMDGIVDQVILGTLDGQAQSLTLDASVIPVSDGILHYADTEDGMTLSFYNAESGVKTAAVTLPGAKNVKAACWDGQYVWILADMALYRWDMTQTAVEAGESCTAVLYTAQSPDTQAIAQLQERVDEINQQYGVKIRIWQDAVKTAGDYELTAEHQPAAIKALLDQVEPVLTLFPERFLRDTVKAGWIRICLVRGIEGDKPFVQYWADGDCYIAIALGADVKEAILRGVSYGVDSHVLGNSRDFDTWETLNPEGFAYDYDATMRDPREEDAAYLEGESRAFVDRQSMSFPSEDRSRMLYCAMAEDCADYFTSAAMQAKLLRLCEGIREAYGLEKSTETFLWEQYLTQPLAQ